MSAVFPWMEHRQKKKKQNTDRQKKTNVDEVRRQRTWSWQIKIPPAVSNPTLGSGVGYRNYHTRLDISCEGGLLHKAWDFQETRHVYCPTLLSNSGEAEFGRQNQDHTQFTGPQSMHIHRLGILLPLNSGEGPA